MFCCRLLPGRQHPKAVRYQSERSKNAVALLLRALGNHGFHLRSAHPLVYLRGFESHATNCSGVGPLVSRWAKIFCGVSVKNSPFLSLVGW
jgi:hypothetical protein